MTKTKGTVKKTKVKGTVSAGIGNDKCPKCDGRGVQ